jgi:hypothetical protein
MAAIGATLSFAMGSAKVGNPYTQQSFHVCGADRRLWVMSTNGRACDARQLHPQLQNVPVDESHRGLVTRAAIRIWPAARVVTRGFPW